MGLIHFLRGADARGGAAEIHISPVSGTPSHNPALAFMIYRNDRLVVDAQFTAAELLAAIEEHAPEVIKAAGWLGKIHQQDGQQVIYSPAGEPSGATVRATR